MPTSTLHEVNVALWAWLDADYHRRPNAARMGDTAFHRGRQVRFGPCDPRANRHRRRGKVAADPPADDGLPFDLIAGLLQRAREVHEA